MAFIPVDLPIQELLLSNFVTDIATITNANSLLLKDKLEDLINTFEMDIANLAIGSDNPINYVRSNAFIIQDTGLNSGIIFQTGTPAQTIFRLEKNVNNESVLTVDRINVDVLADVESVTVNDLTVNDTLTSDGPAVLNSSIEFKSAVIESSEKVPLPSAKTLTEARTRVVLNSSSKKNIFLTLRATTAPALDPVYDGVGSFPGIDKFVIYLDFDQDNPPAENSVYTIYLVDIVEDITSSSIMSDVVANLLPIVIKGGTNFSTTPTVPVYLHNNLGVSYDVGVNPNSTNFAGSDVLKSNVPSAYGHNISLFYLLDENLNDRLMITSMVGMEFFNP